MIESQVYYGEPAPSKSTIEKWLRKLPAGVEIFLADNHKMLVGFMSISTLFPAGTSPRLYIQDLYVSTNYRRKSIGRQFIEKAANLAIKRGYDRVIFSVFDASGEALKFYKKIGVEARPRMIYNRLMGENLKALANAH